MKLKDFHYDLPEGLIAQYPLKRGTGRLMLVNRSKEEIFHLDFRDLSGRLFAGDALVMNDSRVIPARLRGWKVTGGRVEIFLLKDMGGGRWEALVKSSKPSHPGTEVLFENGLKATVLERKGEEFTVFFEKPELIRSAGKMPLPPYIARDAEESDIKDYQTVYAANEGSVAAPTAGLHFTKELLGQLTDMEVITAYVTLHVGLGTFKPVRVNDINEHIMHSEEFFVDEKESLKINMAMHDKRRIVSVGTTTTRVLEHLMQRDGEIRAGRGSTDIFIRPGFEFKCVNALLTNFHLPCSTLIMLVCAFGGYELIMKAYREAVRERYRFFSYGDAMFII